MLAADHILHYTTGQVQTDASKSKAVSTKHLGETEAQLRQEVAELFGVAEKAEKGEAQLPEGLFRQDEIALRQGRLAKLAEAKAVLEARTQERSEAEQADGLGDQPASVPVEKPLSPRLVAYRLCSPAMSAHCSPYEPWMISCVMSAAVAW
jgi:hypothetical protein